MVDRPENRDRTPVTARMADEQLARRRGRDARSERLAGAPAGRPARAGARSPEGVEDGLGDRVAVAEPSSLYASVSGRVNSRTAGARRTEPTSRVSASAPAARDHVQRNESGPRGSSACSRLLAREPVDRSAAAPERDDDDVVRPQRPRDRRRQAVRRAAERASAWPGLRLRFRFAAAFLTGARDGLRLLRARDQHRLGLGLRLAQEGAASSRRRGRERRGAPRGRRS